MSTPPFLTLPPGVRTRRFSGGAGELAALQADPRDCGWSQAPRGDIVLVPGFTGSKEDFIAVLGPLAGMGWQVTAYDQRGQYESSGPDDAAAYSLECFAEDLLRVAAALPGPVHVVGHSFGGLVAREAALRARTRELVASLVLLCSGPGPIPVEDHVGLAFVRDQLPALDLGTLYDLTLMYTGSAPPPGDVGRFLRERYVSNNPWCLGTIAGHLIAAEDRTDELVELAHAGLPVAVVYGESDDAWPLAEQDAVALACGTTAVVIPDAGHSPAVDQPALTAAALDAILTG